MSIVPAESPVKATFSFAPRVNPGKEGEKYYMMGYVPENHFARCNFEYEEIGGIDVGNLRTSGFTSTKDGVELVPIHSKMEYDHYEDKAKVEAVYLQEVSELLKTHLQMKEVYIFEYLVRRTEASFPYLGDKPFKTPQPAIAVHIDHTPADIRDRIHHLWKGDAENFLQREFQVVNVWKPLRGPVRDWPMAYCDRATVDYANDLTEIDDVGANVVNEVLNVHFNPSQRWYYVPNQLPNEAVVFCEYDSRHTDAAIPHCSFQAHLESETSQRESVEVRALIFF